MRVFISFLFFLSVINIAAVHSEEDVGSAPNVDSMHQQMNNERLQELLRCVDPELKGHFGLWTMEYENFVAQIITDKKANRMRVIVPIVKVEDVEETEFYA